ncbi:MAG: hypothetical protein HY614_02215 [Candidatus Rokubacteria bacterium]|nr:hypothetical protein [Candidatus Rokubacteria bacterium]
MSRYEIVPLRAVLPAIPTLDTTSRPLAELRDEHVIRVTGATTLPCTVAGAEAHAQALLAVCRERVEAGHPEVLLELLDAHPDFIKDRWVRETIGHLARDGKLRRRRGRVRGRRAFHPLIVVGLVNHLIRMGDAQNPEQAFGLLEQLEILKYGTAKDLYYRGVREDRFKPILLAFDDLAECVFQDVLEQMLAGAEVLGPGMTITRRVSDPELGEVEIIFTAR